MLGGREGHLLSDQRWSDPHDPWRLPIAPTWNTPPARPPLPPLPIVPQPRREGGWRQSWVPVVLAMVALVVGVLGVGVALDRHTERLDTISPPTTLTPSTELEPTPSVPPRQGLLAPAPPTTVPGPATLEQADVAAIAARVENAVVDISTAFGSGTRSAGTGMVLTASGAVLTNYHVIEAATSINVQVNGQGPTYTAKVVGTSRAEDVAVIQLDGASGLTPIAPGNASNVRVGDPVVALGNALGRSGPLSVVSGTVAALNQTATASDPGAGTSETLAGLIQTTAPLQPGDSGGALVNASSQVIGMNTAAALRNRGGIGVAFAIPINRALSIAADIRAGRGSSVIQVGAPGFLGVQVNRDAVITRIVPGMPADTAGLVVGDRLVGVDDKTIDSSAALTTTLADYRAGDQVTLAWVDTSGVRRTIRVKLAAGTS